ncbi:hypothetical protein V6N12_069854 [Hibiscus sabdariffa]|uniref:Uncharacterized protein n=1 Tax=Hibiscus sabdariffa TaxID=183260 RepID=A0ABR2FF58_9ROSI
MDFAKSVEDVDHVLRRYPLAIHTWRQVVHVDKVVSFLSLPFDTWLPANLKGEGSFSMDDSKWVTQFVLELEYRPVCPLDEALLQPPPADVVDDRAAT